MKKTFTTFAFVALLPVAFAQQKMMDNMKMDDMQHMDMMKKSAADTPSTHTATGIVKKIDAAKGVITIAHEPVRSLNWPAMTMGFMVKDKALLEKFVVGKKVNFEFVPGDKGYVITAIK